MSCQCQTIFMHLLNFKRWNLNLNHWIPVVPMLVNFCKPIEEIWCQKVLLLKFHTYVFPYGQKISKGWSMCCQLEFLKRSFRSLFRKGSVGFLTTKKHGWKMKIVALISSIHERSFLSLSQSRPRPPGEWALIDQFIGRLEIIFSCQERDIPDGAAGQTCSGAYVPIVCLFLLITGVK